MLQIAVENILKIICILTPQFTTSYSTIHNLPLFWYCFHFKLASKKHQQTSGNHTKRAIGSFFDAIENLLFLHEEGDCLSIIIWICTIHCPTYVDV